MVAQAFGMKWLGVLQRAVQDYKVSDARYETGLSTDLFIAANVVEQDAITAHLKWAAKGAPPPARYQNVLEPLLPSTTTGENFGRLSAPGTNAK